ncbi:MAG: hypothetical protein FWD57_02725, partial [Polyangiaceae bacterium]|nr:hypothetical protein [Polyangiaceae bacterium]
MQRGVAGDFVRTKAVSNPGTPPVGLKWVCFSAGPLAIDLIAWVLAGTTTGAAFSVADGFVRFLSVGTHPAGWNWGSHAIGALALYCGLGSCLGLAIWLARCVDLLARILVAPIGLPSVSSAVRGLVRSVLGPATAGASGAAWLWTANASPPSAHIDWVALGCGFVGIVALVAIGVPLGDAWLQRVRRFWVLCGALLLLGCVFAWLDMSVLAELYPFVHAVVELWTATVWLIAFRLMFGAALGRKQRDSHALVLAPLLAALTAGFVIARVPAWAADRLRHTATHRVFVGRVLARAHRVPSYADLETRRRSDTESAAAGLGANANSADPSPADACPQAWWPSEGPARSANLRAAMPDQPNIVVYFVDALRADTASDPRIMPNLAKFTGSSLSFTRAYSTGSDTRSALPAITRGCYDLERQDGYDAVNVARTHGMNMALAIGTSPREFLAKHVPQFKFEEVREVADADTDKKVWGYGAHYFTAEQIVDASTEWIREQGDNRFFIWLHHYDLHGWRELDTKELARKSKALGVPQLQGEWNRYGGAAATIDAAFGKLLGEIERQELSEK